MAARQPALLIVEDVHWLDTSSRDLLSFVVHNARHDRLVVVVTYRPDELHRGHPLRPFVAELERSGRAERIELGGLDRADVTEQIRAITGRQPPCKTIDEIFARSEGNPFFVEELLASTSRGAALPSSLREALLLRVAGLSAPTQAVLSAAAVIGRSVDHRLLASIAGGSERDLLASLREATEHYVFVATGDSYRFRHALLREAIYEDTEELHGFSIDGVDLETSVLPEGWRDRLVKVQNANTAGPDGGLQFTGWCLDKEDVCVTKLCALREKDQNFVSELLRAGLVDSGVIAARLAAVPERYRPDADRAAEWLASWA